jgi:hypothetical protein
MIGLARSTILAFTARGQAVWTGWALKTPYLRLAFPPRSKWVSRFKSDGSITLLVPGCVQSPTMVNSWRRCVAVSTTALGT